MKALFVLVGIAITLLASDAAFARRQVRASGYNIYDQLFTCDKGRTVQWHGSVMYVDGLAARNGITYEIHCSFDDLKTCSLWENSFHTDNCHPNQLPPPAPPAKRWDNYVKVCNGQQVCHWESREIQ